MGSPLVEVVATQTGGDDVHSPDVAKGSLSLLEGLLGCIVG